MPSAVHVEKSNDVLGNLENFKFLGSETCKTGCFGAGLAGAAPAAGGPFWGLFFVETVRYGIFFVI